MTPLAYVGHIGFLGTPLWAQHGWLWFDPTTGDVLAQHTPSEPLRCIGRGRNTDPHDNTIMLNIGEPYPAAKEAQDV